jgi:hypothetical protein
MASKLCRIPWACWFLLTWGSSLLAASTEDAELARQIAAAEVPVERIAGPSRAPVVALLKQPCVYARGPVEAFPCTPAVYEWLLDRPDLVARAWRALGATCAAVERRPDGSFCGKEQAGGEARWAIALKEPGRRIWYVEGNGRPLPLTPKVSGRAVVVLYYQEVKGLDGRTGVRHRTEIFAQCDDRPAAWVAKLFGASAEQVAGKTLQQIELFYSAMTWHVCEHPAWAKSALGALTPEERRLLESLKPD